MTQALNAGRFLLLEDSSPFIVVPPQDNSYPEHSLKHLLTAKPTTPTPAAAIKTSSLPCPITPYNTQAGKLRHTTKNTSKTDWQETDILEQNQAIQRYYRHISTIRGNDGILPHSNREITRAAIKRFALFANLPIANDSYTKLIQYKRENPLTTTIEETLADFAAIPTPKSGSIQSSAQNGSKILGIFRANFTPLQLRINTHFPPAEENCT